MKRFLSMAVSLILLMTFFSTSFPAFGEHEPWGCPDCGRRSNTGNYCGSCGHPAPWIISFEYSIENDEVTITKYIGQAMDVTIPETIQGKKVTSIGPSAFYNCSSLVNVTVSNSVTNIDNYAFHSCSNLTNVTIPNSVTSIGSCVFFDCSNLTSVMIPNSVTGIGDSTFYGCRSLTSIVIPNSVTSIGNSAFYECRSLTSVTIPNSVTSIGDSAFYGCRSLTSVTIPNSMTSIGRYAFLNCSSNLTVFVETVSVEKGFYVAQYCKNNHVNYTYTITSTGNTDTATDYKYTVENGEVTITKYIGQDTNVTIPETIQGKKVTKIGEKAFYCFNSLTSVTIPFGVTSIGDDAFDGCQDLMNVTIPSSVISIGRWAFADLKSLTSITIPGNGTSIGNLAFTGCSNLKKVTILSGVTSIGNGAFFDCTSLTSVTIPNSVTSIGDDVFHGCSQLTISAEVGSYAEQYCKKNGIKITTIDLSAWIGDPAIVGSYVKIGHYEQDNNLSNGAEPIEWYVLKHDAENNKSLLISRYGLDVHEFDSHHLIPADKKDYPSGKVNMYPGWAESDIRLWLNDSFLNNAFSAEEQNYIIESVITTESCMIRNRASWEPEYADGGEDVLDKIFLLSSEEVSSLLPLLPCHSTKYAEARGTARDNATDAVQGYCRWWLRSPQGADIRFADCITPQGLYGGADVILDDIAIRPALWLNLDSNISKN